MMLDVILLALVQPAPDQCATCEIDPIGIYTGMSAEETAALSQAWPPSSSPSNPTSWYEYSAVIDCFGNTPEDPGAINCAAAVNYCALRAPESSGPRSFVHRRQVSPDGAGDWEIVRETCFSDMVPARSGDGAELTEAMIIEQFHRTDFALPATLIQPPDNRALVNLPVYFEVGWPEDGYSPDEVDTTTILGREVRIRPTFHEATYNFGDGTVTGPTTSLGGPWPEGDITHEYTDAASVSTSVSVVYGGEVSIDGGAWTVIPSTVSVTGPAQPLEILTSSNRLYDD